MSLKSALAAGRRAAEARMTDACTSRRQTGTTYDADDVPTPSWTDLYAGPCRLRQPGTSGGRANVGEADVVLLSPEIHLPMTAALLEPGDEITLTASAEDPLSAGRVFRVHAAPAHSQATARRYEVIERTS